MGYLTAKRARQSHEGRSNTLRASQSLQGIGGLHPLEQFNHVKEMNIFCRKKIPAWYTNCKSNIKAEGVNKQFISCLFPSKHETKNIPDPTLEIKENKTALEYYWGRVELWVPRKSDTHRKGITDPPPSLHNTTPSSKLTSASVKLVLISLNTCPEIPHGSYILPFCLDLNSVTCSQGSWTDSFEVLKVPGLHCLILFPIAAKCLQTPAAPGARNRIPPVVVLSQTSALHFTVHKHFHSFTSWGSYILVKLKKGGLLK